MDTVLDCQVLPLLFPMLCGEYSLKRPEKRQQAMERQEVVVGDISILYRYKQYFMVLCIDIDTKHKI